MNKSNCNTKEKNTLPLVSILIANYNYENYLKNCFESVLNQTYSNIEVIFSDNNSDDKSYEIAKEYQKIFKDKNIFFKLMNNKRNVGSSMNCALCYREAEGDYIIYLSSDDYLESTAVEKCIKIMENNKNVGAVMYHRNEVDEKGEIYTTKPFYNANCIINGEDQAAVFMMAGIAVPSQVIFRKSIYDKSRKIAGQASYQVAGDWFNNFIISLYSDYAYLKEPLCNYRVHSGNETNLSEVNLTGIFEHYQLINHFFRLAKEFRYFKVIERYDEAVKKLGSMCLRYALKMLKANEIKSAKKYLQLAPVFDEDIIENEEYKKMKKLVKLNNNELKEVLKYEPDIVRNVSYNPPLGSKEINI